jgi:two-component system CheB/CheR fusion protein
MGVHQIEKISEYVRYLQENPEELEILFNELLIGVTSFFRDAAVWENLKEEVFPSMLSKLPGGYVLRAWVPGCSTGEEAYSLAMVLKEAFDKLKSPNNLSFQIFATDLDSDAVEKARKGVFPANITADVPPERLSRFFIETAEGYRVKSEIREMIVFAVQNVIKDPPFTRLEILSCRNLLIYLEPALQKKLLGLFHYSLLPGGVMILGNSESPGDSAELFQPLEPKLRLFKRLADSALTENLDFPASLTSIKKIPKDEPMQSKQSLNIQALVDQMLLQQFSPSGVLVNDNGDILYTSGRTGKYLEPPVGKVNWNIFAMLRDGLRSEFPMAFRKALIQKSPVVMQNAEVGTNGGKQLLDVILQQIETPEALKGKVMVIFKDVSAVAGKKPFRKKSLAGSQIMELEQELQKAREGIQSMHEEMQTSQEELKSANEELQSTNEELQSTNEELMTSKEEMQSMNEELQTLNSELQSKVDDLTKVKNDISNLMNSTEIASLFLDKGLKIRQFTSQMTRIIKLIPGDVGRPFTDLVSALDYPGFSADATEVLRTLVFIEKIIPSTDERWFKVRIMPYRTTDDRIDGLVITFSDITESKMLEKELLKTGMMMSLIVDSIPEPIICMSSQGHILEFNSGAEKTLGMKRGDVIGKNYFREFVPVEKQKKAIAEMAKLIEGGLTGQMETLARTATGGECRIDLIPGRIFDDKGNILRIILIGRKWEKS